MFSSNNFADLKDRLQSATFWFFGIRLPLLFALLGLTLYLLVFGIQTWMNRDKWSTLRHEEFGFSVRYPANWVSNVYDESGFKNDPFLRASVYSRATLWHYWGLEIYRIPLSTIDPERSPTSEVAIVEQIDGSVLFTLNRIEASTLSQLQEVTIGAENYRALRRTFQTDGTRPLCFVHYYHIEPDALYVLSFYEDCDNEQTQVVFDTMLSSFRLLDESG